MPGIDALIDEKRLLLVVATPLEASPLCRGLGCSDPAGDTGWRVLNLTQNTDLVICGVGKANAAAAAALALSQRMYGCVLSIGIAGLLPIQTRQDAGSALLGDLVVATESVFADEGIDTPDGFLDLGRMGFPCNPAGGCGFGCDPAIVALAPAWGASTGKIATVSTCSGTDARAAHIAQRTGCLAEGMEGAAVALVAARFGVPFGEVRAFSNTTGDRQRQNWQMPRALATLTRLGGFLRA